MQVGKQVADAEERRAKLRAGCGVMEGLAGSKFFEDDGGGQAGSRHGAPSNQTAAAKPIELTFGKVEDWWGGVAALVGTPDPVSLSLGMEIDHTNKKTDSQVIFYAANYGTETTAEAEYWFVVEPTAKRLRELARDILQPLSLSEWPIDRKLRDDPAQAHQCRKATPLSEFEDERSRLSKRLHRTGQTLTEEMVVAARLYTGPMFTKYNLVLRAKSGKTPFFTERWEKLCRGNTYATTMHVINSALRGLSPLTKCKKVYRGVAGGSLPEAFHKPDQLLFRGGVEFAFMSTTLDRDFACHYACGMGSSDAGMGIVFELNQGMVDKGANLQWLSQYPHEAEICFPPLTGLELRGTKVEGSVLFVQVEPKVNFRSHEIEETDEVREFKRADLDQTGMLDLQEFERFALRLLPKSYANLQRIKEIFLVADVDHSGMINFGEFRTGCSRLIHDEATKFEIQRAAEEKAAHEYAIEAARLVGKEQGRIEKQRAEARLKEEAIDEVKRLRARVDHVTEKLNRAMTELASREAGIAGEYLSQRRAVSQVAASILSLETNPMMRSGVAASRSRKVFKLARAIETAAFPTDPRDAVAGQLCEACGAKLKHAASTGTAARPTKVRI